MRGEERRGEDREEGRTAKCRRLLLLHFPILAPSVSNHGLCVLSIVFPLHVSVLVVIVCLLSVVLLLSLPLVLLVLLALLLLLRYLLLLRLTHCLLLRLSHGLVFLLHGFFLCDGELASSCPDCLLFARQFPVHHSTVLEDARDKRLHLSAGEVEAQVVDHHLSVVWPDVLGKTLVEILPGVAQGMVDDLFRAVLLFSFDFLLVYHFELFAAGLWLLFDRLLRLLSTWASVLTCPADLLRGIAGVLLLQLPLHTDLLLHLRHVLPRAVLDVLEDSRGEHVLQHLVEELRKQRYLKVLLQHIVQVVVQQAVQGDQTRLDLPLPVSSLLPLGPHEDARLLREIELDGFRRRRPLHLLLHPVPSSSFLLRLHLPSARCKLA
mmetsp:Transcript_8738/g.29168  ORF Transcript_8738/g.29168 Transcript_8738/m.29168 type:complete len:378 (+) Transcript_8738:128-1261(+)